MLAVPRLFRHIEPFRRTQLPGQRVVFFINTAPVGFVTPELAQRLLAYAPVIGGSVAGLCLHEPNALADIAGNLAAEGWFAWRGEAFDVRAPDGAVLAQIDRGALPAFGIEGHGVHLNGLVARADGLHVWLGRRADTRPADPGKRDHLVAGGIPAGLSPWQTLMKEAEEEAGLPPAVTRQAKPVCEISYTIERQEGLRRDRLFCFDLLLPEDFVPHPQDGEVTDFALWPLPDIVRLVAETDEFKFNVNLVLIDLFLRNGLDDPEGALRAALSNLSADWKRDA